MLALAGNPIGDVLEIQLLAKCASLLEVSNVGVEKGTCGVSVSFFARKIQRFEILSATPARTLQFLLSFGSSILGSLLPPDHPSCPHTVPGRPQLSFADPHFADAPIAAVPGYRQLALTSLPQLQSLDCAAVTAKERQLAEDASMRSMLDFVTVLDQLRHRHEGEFQAIQQSRAVQSRNVAAVAARVSDRLAMLEVSERGTLRVREHYRDRDRVQICAKALRPPVGSAHG